MQSELLIAATPANNPLRKTEQEVDDCLASLKKQFALVRDRVKQVASGGENGLILCGEGGVGKSRAVLQTLKECEASFTLINSQLTPKGLFDLIVKQPNGIFVIEDAEQMLQRNPMAGLLRSALFSQEERNKHGRQPRRITWQTARGELSVNFTGGLIIIMNRSMPNTPEMEAIKTRVPVIDMKVTPEEMEALLRELSSKEFVDGDLSLPIDKCREVCEFLIDESAKLGRRLNLRFLFNAFRDRCSWESGEAQTSWQEMVISRIREDATGTFKPKSKAEKTRREFELLEELAKKSLVRLQLTSMFVQETGYSRATAYRRVDAFLERRAGNAAQDAA